jgi:hypothetical protein
MEDCHLMLALHRKMLVVCDSCSEEVLIIVLHSWWYHWSSYTLWSWSCKDVLLSKINLQILSENDKAFTTKKSKLSLILSQSYDDQNMKPFFFFFVSPSCIVSSHPLHGPPWNNSYGFVHWMLHIHLKIWDYLLTIHPRHLHVVITDVPSCRQNLMLALKDAFLFQNLACTAGRWLYVQVWYNMFTYILLAWKHYTTPVRTTVFLKMYPWVQNM